MPVISREIAIQNHYPIGKYFIQTIIIPKNYTKQQAIAWLEKNDYRHGYHRTTSNFHRFMQHNPVKGAKYYTESLPNGIDLIYQKFK